MSYNNKLSIPAADFRVLLIQLVLRLVHRLAKTLQPHTKRASLLDDLLDSTLLLERELKRDVTMEVTRVNKRTLWDALFSNRLPEWLQVDLMDCLREEEVKSITGVRADFIIIDEMERLGKLLSDKELPEDYEPTTVYVELDDEKNDPNLSPTIVSKKGEGLHIEDVPIYRMFPINMPIPVLDKKHRYTKEVPTDVEMDGGLDEPTTLQVTLTDDLVDDLREVPWDQLDPNRYYLEYPVNEYPEEFDAHEDNGIVGNGVVMYYDGQIDTQYDLGYDWCLYFELPLGMDFSDAEPTESKEDLREVPYDQLESGRWYLEASDISGWLSYYQEGIQTIVGEHGEIYKAYNYSSDFFTYYELPKGLEL